MVVTQGTFIINTLPTPYLFHTKNGRNFRQTVAQKRDVSKNPTTRSQPILPFRLSNTFLARSAIAVLALGFIDAGYSGDWSRIGVISKDTEDLLKLSAFLFVPLCLFLILSISKKPEA